ncbi:Uncharacterized conserved protein PhnB, glyoxalase superfamily [Microbacterium hydrocarbonoxydans]|uniref:Uncharacterized conserved protein PhnB, glyoxalase superfamily n=2 Tax=Microbacterium hydrocarbonoxydans TaxID=273678 RepID=A0A1H4P551_9MICO|nr:Uncharacterized conserved protein PhnB, glyoxalase superfamily [Microbacterium hydrocarbonoxydans]
MLRAARRGIHSNTGVSKGCSEAVPTVDGTPVDRADRPTYPAGMTVSSLFPILRTGDLPRLTRFYEAAFGAEVRYRFEQDGVDVYVALTVGGGTLGIGLEHDIPRGEAIAVWIYTDDAGRAFTDAIAAGTESVAAPEDMPWGERVAQVHDPDANLLYLATPPPPS